LHDQNRQHHEQCSSSVIETLEILQTGLLQ
jgi:hypothetical protein